MTNELLTDDPFDVWTRECERARKSVFDWPRAEEIGEIAIEAAEHLLAVARVLKGVACETCGGFGYRAYGSTSTWSGGASGCSITPGVCDKCWGTGRTDQTGPDLRKLRGMLRAKGREDGG